jgi:ATP-binding cassette subfamily B protein
MRADLARGLRSELRLIVRRGRQVWKLIPLRYRLALGGAALLMAVTSAANTAIAVLLGRLVDRIKSGTEEHVGPAVMYEAAAFFLGLIATTYLLRELLQVGRRYLVENTCTRIDRDMMVRLVAHLLKVDLSSFTHEKVGALHGRITRSVDGFVRFLRLGFLTFFPALLTGLFALGATAAKQPWVGAAMLGVIPASIALTAWQLVSQKGVRLKLLRTREEMDGTVVEQLAGLDYIRAANTCAAEAHRVAAVAEAHRRREIRHHFKMSLFGCAKALTEGFFHILVLALATAFAIQGRITYGDIMTFSILFLNVMTPLSEIHRVLDEGHEASLHVGDLIDMLRSPVDCSFRADDGVRPALAGDGPLIEVDGLRVDYTTADGARKCALDGVSLTVGRGERVGIAGRSGGGKTTWLKALLRLVHPTAGRVTVGGVPLESLSRAAIGDLIGYVGQSPFVFSGTIEANITYGMEAVPPEAVRRAAAMACLHDEIMAMPGGYQAKVAERGRNLSGGQKQRLALARIFLKNPPILILDEATSALDTISERIVQRAIAAAQQGRTVVVVAHRLSTLLDADRILVFDNGRIVESGSYGALEQSGGAFAELLRYAHDSPRGEGQAPEPVPAESPDVSPVEEPAREESPVPVPAPAVAGA